MYRYTNSHIRLIIKNCASKRKKKKTPVMRNIRLKKKKNIAKKVKQRIG